MKPGGHRRRVSLIVGLCLAMGVIAGADEQTGGEAADQTRKEQQSVLLAKLPATVNDVVDRVRFEVAGDDVSVKNVWFQRRPYVLADGSVIRQTPAYFEDVYVRQIIEHPFAGSTVVIYPGTESGLPLEQALSMLSIIELNEGPDLSLTSESGGSVAAAVAGSLDLRYVEFPPAKAPVPSSARISLSAEDMNSLIEGRDGILQILLDGQGLLVVEQIEREIRSRVALVGRGEQVDIDTVNHLQDELAVLLARTDFWSTIFQPENPILPEIETVLADIDALLNASTGAIFTEGLAGIRDLFTSKIPRTLDGFVLESAARGQSFDEAQDVARFVAGLSAGGLCIVEGDDELVLALVNESLATSAFNLVIMSGAGGTERVDSRQALSLVSTISDEVVIPPSMDPVPDTDSYRMQLQVARLEMADALDRLESSSVTIGTWRTRDQATLIGLVAKMPGRSPLSRFFLVPGNTPSEVARATMDLLADGVESDVFLSRLLSRWAVVVTTAMDL